MLIILTMNDNLMLGKCFTHSKHLRKSFFFQIIIMLNCAVVPLERLLYYKDCQNSKHRDQVVAYYTHEYACQSRDKRHIIKTEKLPNKAPSFSFSIRGLVSFTNLCTDRQFVAARINVSG